MSDDETPFDPLPGIKAEIDQALELTGDLGRVARAWYAAFETEGFTEKQSLWLTAVQLVSDPGEPPAGADG